MQPRRHFVIPDTQVKPGVPTIHFDWVGRAIRDYKPDVVIHIGDHWDFPSLSGYATPKEMEGNRYEEDVKAGNDALYRLDAAMGKFKGRKVLLRGNHEDRLTRAISANPKWAGAIGFHQFVDRRLGWEVVDYFQGSPQPIVIDGVTYAHYFANPNTGKPIGGTITNRLAKIGTTFVQGHVQGLLQGNVQFATGITRHGIVAGSCLTPDHRVLTADLRYVPLGSVRPGDKLVSFDEQPESNRKRRYRTGTVEAVKRDTAECFAVTLASGKVFKVTGDHYWLTRVGGPTAQKNGGATYLWRQTSQLRRGTLIPRPLGEWNEADNRDAGYLRGVYDGEGCLYARSTDSSGGAVMQLGLAQKPGLVLDECLRILRELVGVDGLTHTNQKGVSDLRLKGGARKCAEVLGSIRPLRLLAKFAPPLLGSMTAVDNDKVVDIQPIGDREIVRIAIDEKTMIVEGYPHHNCYLHDETYKGVANAHWRGVVVLNEVRDGDFCEMPLSLDYLCRKYTGKPLDVYMRKHYKNAELRFTCARRVA